MGSEKRERQKDNRRSRLEAEAEAWKKQQRNKRLVTFLIAAFVLGLVVLIVNVFGEDEETESADDPVTTTTPGDTGPVYGTGECPEEDGSSPQTLEFEDAPQLCIDPTMQYDAVVTTDVGEFTITLDAAAAPMTVNNFVVLSRYHFYDDVAFHRVIPGFVVQGGDPVGEVPGTGDPGYSIPDELPPTVESYVRGSVAMANSGPDTNGSQFFVWMGPQTLPAPDYSLFGLVTDGLDVVEQIEADGSADGTPATEHRIVSIEIVERAAETTTTGGAPDSTATTAAPESTATTDRTATTLPEDTTTAPVD